MQATCADRACFQRMRPSATLQGLPTRPSKPPYNQNVARILALALLGVAALGFGCTVVPTGQNQPAASPTDVVDANPAIAVYGNNSAKVVNINTLALVRTVNGVAAQPQGVGTGFVYDTDAHIVTNEHVLTDASQILVTFKDGTATPGKLVGQDAYLDLAVIQVASLPSGIQPVALGDSDNLRIGQTALAIGSPLGLQQTLTQGIVSAVRIPDQDPSSGAIDLPAGAVQTDASINPGNSGGPLFDIAGNVIGVNTAILSQSGGSQGIGFAIPINVVKRVVPDLIQYGVYRHPSLGIVGVPLAAIGGQTRQQMGVPPDVQEGVVVLQVAGGAQQAGIQPGALSAGPGGQPTLSLGDIVVAIDGRPIGTPGQIIAYIDNNRRPGDTVTVTVVRKGQRTDVPVTLGERPQQ
jgi:S1-C subfamily serine protease